MVTKDFLVIGIMLGFLPLGCGAGKVAKQKASLVEIHKPSFQTLWK